LQKRYRQEATVGTLAIAIVRIGGEAMAEPFLGQIIAVGFNFAPIGWELCQGQLLPIDQNPALYQLIGTTYGGDGATTFALPNLCGRVAISQGQGPTLSNYSVGQLAGSETVSLTAGQNAAHIHQLMASSQTGSTITPDSTMALASNSAPDVNMYAHVAPTTALQSYSITPAIGAGMPHENRQPYVTVNYIIATAGQFPSRG
jgi:microcystin-dependent protein